jgi:cytochrome c oxidase subunit 2
MVKQMQQRLIQAGLVGILISLGTAVEGLERPEVQKIEITATKFAFSPSEITVKKGQQVELEIHSSDANHGLAIQELGIRTEVPKGQTETVTFHAEEVGTFEGKCAHFCGKGHGSMKLAVHVVE